MYVNRPKNTLKGFYSKPRGIVQNKSTQIRWFSGQSDRRRYLVGGSQRHSKTKLAQRGPSGFSPNPLRSDASCDGQAGGGTL